MDALIRKAEVLVEALPYIRKFAGKTVVVKYGGNAMINEELKNSVMQDVTLLKYIGVNPIIVHGGGPEISKLLGRLKIESEFVNGLRRTDAATMEVAQMVLVGKTNKEIVSLINRHGGKAVGVSGIDGNLIECVKMTRTADGAEADLGFVGEITAINTQMLEVLARGEFIPVVAPVGVGPDGESYNINADTAASEIAAALHAEKLILLTDIEGVKADMAGEGIITFLDPEKAQKLIDEKVIVGGMIPKVLGCVESVRKGVRSVHIVDGRVPHCLLLEIFTDKGIGTMFRE
jgi:acetylglutamate kinase